MRDGLEVAIGSRAFDMLVALVSRQGEVLSRRELMACAWSGLSVEDSNVRVQMAHLRRELGCGIDGIRYVTSVAGRGYCFVMPVEIGGNEALTVFPSVEDLTLRPLDGDDISTSFSQHDGVGIDHLPSDRILGRSKNLEELTAAVQERRLVTVVGPGGVGKTTIAKMLAVNAEAFGEIKFVDLSVVVEEAFVSNAIALSINPGVRGNDRLCDALNWLGDRRCLLILDNCEHLIDAVVHSLSAILASSRNIHVLATSIEALRVSGESVYLLRPLGTPPNTGRMTASHVLTWPAVELFMQRAADGGHLAGLTDDDAASVAAICRRLDGNPLAIELVASRVGMYGLHRVLDLLDNQLSLRWRGDRDAAPRHQTVQSLLDWSYALLSDNTQTVLNRLSVLAGEFDMDAATEVAADDRLNPSDVATAISELVDKSLVMLGAPDDVSGQLRLREIVRIYATSKLAASGDRARTQRRHALHCVRQMQSRNDISRGGRVAKLRSHLGNIRAALEWCFSDGGDEVFGAELSVLCVEASPDPLQLDECARWCKRALETLGLGPNREHLRLRLWECLATVWFGGGVAGEDVEAAFANGLELSLKLDERRRYAHLLAGLCMYHLKKGDARSARDVAVSYRDLAKAEGGAQEGVVAGWMLGTIHHLVGENLKAEETLDSSLPVTGGPHHSGLGHFDRAHLAAARSIRARVFWIRGLPDVAMQMAESSIDEARSNFSSLCTSLIVATSVFLLSGELDRAEASLDELESLSLRPGAWEYSDACNAMRGQLLVLRGSPEACIEILNGKATSISSFQLHAMIHSNLRALAEAYSMIGKHPEALSTIDAALVHAERSGGTYLVPELLRTKAAIVLSAPRPDFDMVHRALDQGTAIARASMAFGWELRLHLTRLKAEEAVGRPAANSSLTKLTEILHNFRGGHETTDLRMARSYLGRNLDAALAS